MSVHIAVGLVLLGRWCTTSWYRDSLTGTVYSEPNLFYSDEFATRRRREAIIEVKGPVLYVFAAVVHWTCLGCLLGICTLVTVVLQTNKRNYFGPVGLYRIKVRIITDKGVTLDLHGADIKRNDIASGTEFRFTSDSLLRDQLNILV
jgi:hypothetical protein